MFGKRTKRLALAALPCLLLALLIVPGSTLAIDATDRPASETGIETWSVSGWMASWLDWLGSWLGVSPVAGSATSEPCSEPECEPPQGTTGEGPQPSGESGGTTTSGGGGEIGGHLDPGG